MANKKIDARLQPIMHAYLEDLARVGAYGRDKSDVARTLIEAGIRDAIEKQVIKARTVEPDDDAAIDRRRVRPRQG